MARRQRYEAEIDRLRAENAEMREAPSLNNARLEVIVALVSRGLNDDLIAHTAPSSPGRSLRGMTADELDKLLTDRDLAACVRDVIPLARIALWLHAVEVLEVAARRLESRVIRTAGVKIEDISCRRSPNTVSVMRCVDAPVTTIGSGI